MTANAAGKKFTLVIDAGHGGHDAGAKGAFSLEKTINLNTALAFGRYVERNCPDVNVVYTRKTDVFIPLHTRADIANKNKADLFVSIHTNSLPAGRIARGLETYTLGMHRANDNLDVAKRENSVISLEKDYKQRYEGFDPNSSESYIMFEFIQDKNMAKSVELARLVQRRVCAAAGRPDKGVKQAGFLVLRETSMPSCLIELGFISTPDEEELLNNTAHVDEMARGIYQAFVEYKNKYDQNITVPYKAETRKQPDIPQIVPTEYKEKATEKTKKDTPPAPKPQAEKPQAEPQQQEQPAPMATLLGNASQAGEAENKGQGAETQAKADAQPVFKVQILASSRQLREGDTHLKGVNNCECYEEGNLYKYTSGASTDYNEIYRLRKELVAKFPEAFIVAFKNGEKMDVNQAIREYKQHKR